MLRSLANALAPDVAPIVDFRHHWNTFLRFYAEHKPLGHKSQPVERTNLGHHLNAMIKILAAEDELLAEVVSGSTDRIGPCMEFLIEHQLLDILSTICMADSPPGIRPVLFEFFVLLLGGRINSVNMLPYVSVYLPVRRMLLLSTMTKASPTESFEIKLITTILSLIRKTPELLALFAHHSTRNDTSHCSSRSLSRNSSLVDLSHIEEWIEPGRKLMEQFESRHLLVSALLNLVDSADYLIAIRAMDALQLTCALPDEIAALNAVQGTSLCDALAKRLAKLLDSIPSNVEVGMLEDIRVNWAEAHHLHAPGSSVVEFRGKAEVVAFFSWFDYCDSLIKTSCPIIADALAHSTRSCFLESSLEPSLFAPDAGNPAALLRALSMLSLCWQHVSSDGLAFECAQWLLGDFPEEREHPVKRRLVDLCRSDSKDVALEALHLFDVLLERPCDQVLQSLVLSHVSQRAYFNGSMAESSISSWSDEEDERERVKRLEAGGGDSPARTIREHTPSKTMAPSNIGRVVNRWLFLVPDQLRASDSARDSGYEQYVINAQKQVTLASSSCQGFRWPREAVSGVNLEPRSPSNASSSCGEDSQVEADAFGHFEEGLLMGALFDLIETLHERDYDVNLQVTTILSRLALLPHPFLHEYLLNPTVPVLAGTRTLFSAMQTATSRIQELLKNSENVHRKIFACRKTLLGSESDRLALNMTKRELRVYDAIIILEEFTKELAAIAIAKYHQYA